MSSRRCDVCLNSESPHRLWFENGFWWYRGRAGCARNISGLLRKAAFVPSKIASGLGLGERTFHRMVKDSLGIPPGEWLRELRAVDAGYRLREGCSIKRMAAEYGFRNAGDFTDEFKRWYGVRPTAYRKNRDRPPDS